MGSALRECWYRTASGVPLFSHDDVHRWSREEFELLVSLGVLRETGPAREVMCDACPEAHWEEVVWKPSVRTATGMRGYIPCPVEMFVPVDPERLRQWTVDIGTAARLIAAGMELSGAVEEKCGGLWWVGRRRLAGRFRDFFLAVKPAALAPDVAMSYAAPVILAVHGHADWHDSGIPAFSLPDVLALTPERVVVDLDYIEDALPRERTPEKAQALRGIPLPDGTSWNDITIEVGDSSLAFSAKGVRRDLGFEESGFADMRQGDLTGDRALQTLRLFAAGRGRFAPRKIGAASDEKTPFKKYVSLLRQRLKGLLPVEGEPIIFEKTSGEYRCAFSVFLESDGGYPTPAGATWQDFRFEELTGGRLRVGVRAREVFQARTTSRGSDRPSSEPAQRDAWCWKEYPLERLQLTNSQGMPSTEGLALLALIRAGGHRSWRL